MSWTPWFTGNKNGEVVGPRNCTTNTVMVGMVAKNQGSYGVINVQLIYSSVRDWNPQNTAWLTSNQNSAEDKQFLCPQGCFINGIIVREEGGHGVTNFKLQWTNVAGDNSGASDWLIPENTATTADIQSQPLPNNNGIVSVEGSEQGSYGIVDVRFGFAQLPVN
jgi:hypothetical protein